MNSTRTIVVEDVGPAGNLVIPVQPGGTIITGYCGTGKSITLEAIALGLGSKERGRVSPREGMKRGSVDCLGVVLNVSAGRVTRSGESEVASIEEFDIGSLIDPPVKEEDARNRYGIKSLLRMTKAEANPSLFYHLAGGKKEFDKIIAPDAVKSADLVEMANKVKRAFEAERRRVLAEVETEETAAAADRNAGNGLDLESETDGARLQAAHSAAVAHHAKLQEQWDAAEDAQASAAEARERLAAIGGESGGQSMQDAQQALEAAKENRDTAVTAAREAKAEVSRLEAALKAAKAEYGSALVAQQAADDAVTAATNAVKAVETNAQLHAGWQAAIDQAAGVHGPKAADVLAAKSAVDTARRAIETAAVVRAAKERVAQAVKHQERAAELRKEAERLKDAAQDTDSVLSAAVASERFVVQRDVLIGVLPDGTAKPFYDLSDGERTLIATTEKIDRVRLLEPDERRLAIIDLPQRTFQDIPASVRKMLFARAAARNVCIVTAQVSDDPVLKAEVVEVES